MQVLQLIDIEFSEIIEVCGYELHVFTPKGDFCWHLITSRTGTEGIAIQRSGEVRLTPPQANTVDPVDISFALSLVNDLDPET